MSEPRVLGRRSVGVPEPALNIRTAGRLMTLDTL
jgi:hypothetical protein